MEIGVGTGVYEKYQVRCLWTVNQSSRGRRGGNLVPEGGFIDARGMDALCLFSG